MAFAAVAGTPLLDVVVDEGRERSACDVVLRHNASERREQAGAANGAKDAAALTAMMSIVPVLLRGAAHAGPRCQAQGAARLASGPYLGREAVAARERRGGSRMREEAAHRSSAPQHFSAGLQASTFFSSGAIGASIDW